MKAQDEYQEDVEQHDDVKSEGPFVSDIRLLAVVGPTASGKSGVAVTLAKRYDAEIVSVDSLQVYRYLDIGTGKVTQEEMEGIPHHLIDCVDPTEPFDAGRFQREADQVIASIHQRGRHVILAGGTGLYLRALLHGLFDVPSDEGVRQALLERVEKGELSVMYEELQEVDPIAATRITPRDRSRIVRALEVFLLTGRPFSSWADAHQHQEQRYPAMLLGIDWPRPTLHERINERVLSMLQQGWAAEAEVLRLRGYGPELKPLQCIGYRELYQVFDGALEPQEATARIQQATRAYAKRQMTWFRKEDVRWFPSPQELLEDATLAGEIEAWWSLS
ncbi:MAG: tRNA (adenosine(37)-N6)-dimethylallyltransferase MiaA [Myxococcales bacterium]|nr:tRNA (adenosine(37)-N6)-dimethylallyltransferase MiaA [Myxococcales bacterium]